MLALSTLVVFPFLMAFAGSSDLFTMTISNRISIALVVAFIGFALLAGLPLETIAWHLSCGLAILVMTFTFFAFGWVGGGDAKLAAATAVWLGWVNILDYGVMTSILGGILTLAFIQIRKAPLPQWAEARDWIARLYNAENGVPYGLALAAAGLIIFPETEIWHAALGI
jgi:prepilin peptidase CpaA